MLETEISVTVKYVYVYVQSNKRYINTFKGFWNYLSTNETLISNKL